ncbi:uncharacterized protein BKA78DRAFT_296624 [Phyllosticta capitalensis]|uniref:uncharacterized protein n=1 Tax=Phyllosticta capitalensis TaxID=121624 RepID=UPI003130BFDC
MYPRPAAAAAAAPATAGSLPCGPVQDHFDRYAAQDDQHHSQASHPAHLENQHAPRPSSISSLHRRPSNAATSPAIAHPPPHDQLYASYNNTPPADPLSPGQQKEEKRSLRSRLGLGHSSKESVDKSSNTALGRRVSVRKKETTSSRPGDHKPWPTSRHNSQHLQTAHEANEDPYSHPDPFLQLQPDTAPPPPIKDQRFAPQAIGALQGSDQHRRPSVARVSVDQSYRGGNAGEYQFSPHPHQASISGFSANPQPPPYQKYAQPPQVQTQHNHQLLQQSHPQSNDIYSPQQHQQQHSTTWANPNDFYAFQQLEQQHPQNNEPRPGSRQQQQQDLQFIPPPKPEQNAPQADVYRPQITRVPVPNQSQKPQQPPIQLQLASPQQSSSYSPGPIVPTRQEVPITPSQERASLPAMAPAAQHGRRSEGKQSTSGHSTFGADVVPAASQGQPTRSARPGNGPDTEVGRGTPSPSRAVSDLSEDELRNILKDHDILREKYQKVKRYFFEQQNQVHQLQNTLASQRISQSRSSLDDGEYGARFNRLEGLISQLAFNVRKEWNSIPLWLQTAVNREACATGKQEMTAVGRAFISAWLIDEVFNKYFHPDLDQEFSAQLKSIQINLRRFAPFSQNQEEEESLTSKIITWRLATLEGLSEQLRSPQATTNRERFIETLNEAMLHHLEKFMEPSAQPDLKSSIPMIIELSVSILSHLPLESRDICIEYFPPGHGIVSEFMRVETGGAVPALSTPVAEGVLQNADSPNSGVEGASSVPEPDADHSDPNSSEATPQTPATQSSPSSATTTAQQQQQQQQQQQHHAPPPPPPEQKQRSSGGTGGMLRGLMGGSSKKQQASQPPPPPRESSLVGAAAGSQVSLAAKEGGDQQAQAQAQPPPQQQPPRVRMAVGLGVRIWGRNVLVKAPVFATTPPASAPGSAAAA